MHRAQTGGFQGGGPGNVVSVPRKLSDAWAGCSVGKKGVQPCFGRCVERCWRVRADVRAARLEQEKKRPPFQGEGAKGGKLRSTRYSQNVSLFDIVVFCCFRSLFPFLSFLPRSTTGLGAPETHRVRVNSHRRGLSPKSPQSRKLQPSTSIANILFFLVASELATCQFDGVAPVPHPQSARQ